jgi:hypothetical protein
MSGVIEDNISPQKELQKSESKRVTQSARRYHKQTAEVISPVNDRFLESSARLQNEIPKQKPLSRNDKTPRGRVANDADNTYKCAHATKQILQEKATMDHFLGCQTVRNGEADASVDRSSESCEIGAMTMDEEAFRVVDKRSELDQKTFVFSSSPNH